MKISFSWLKDYFKTSRSAETVAETLTDAGLEVDGIETTAKGEQVFEISLTPNLAHCNSVRGVARELAALMKEKLEEKKSEVKESSGEPIEKWVKVGVENTAACPRYACRVITGVLVKESPAWLKERLEECGLRSVNNVVDITNYVMLDLGQPLHAFDLAKIEGKQIVVRNAKKGEHLVAINEKEYHPTEETLLICDAKGAVAVAGVIGSAHTEVTESTETVLLEAAYFEPTQVRKSSKRLLLHTDASHRFERGVDPNGIVEALDKAASLIAQFANGKVARGRIDIKTAEFPPKVVSCRLSRVQSLLGIPLAMGEIETIFKRLHFNPVSVQEDSISVAVPTYRHDIHGEIDLIEEVARLYGYKNIHKKEKGRYRTGNLPHSPMYLFEKKVREQLLQADLQELLTCTLISPGEAALMSSDGIPSRSWITLLNPSSQDQSVLRASLLPGHLKTVKYNVDRGNHSILGFEIGRLNFRVKDKIVEPTVASIVLSGSRAQPFWSGSQESVDFFDLKGILENLFSGLKIEDVSFVASSHENFHPGRQASIHIEDREVGIMGEIHPSTLKKIDLEAPVFFAEVHLEELIHDLKRELKMEALPLYPASSRDWTVTLSESTTIGSLLELIAQEKSPLLESFSLHSIYQSEKLGPGLKNVTIRFIYRDREKTVSIEEVEREHQRITKHVFEKLR